MPPKPKFTRGEIVAAALELVSEKGMGALTARDLGARLGSSARPIFTAFKNMEEVQQAVRQAAMDRFNAFAEKAIHYTPAFKQFGMQMILFAEEEPKLFQLLFMTENAAPRDFATLVEDLGEMARVCIRVIEKDYGLTQEDAMRLFQHVWIHTYGVAVLCAARVCRFREEELNEIMGQDFTAMMLLIRSGRLQEKTVTPEKNMEGESYELQG